MKIVIAPDSFKESLTALEVADAIEMGFRQIFPDATYDKVPMADGGEGTVQSMVDATQGQLIELKVTGPLGNQVKAQYGILGVKDGQEPTTAVIEMASASGLHLVPRDQRNPFYTTSFGTGELIKNALDRGIKHIVLGLGGSATNDAGVGLAQALGILFNDTQNQTLPFGGLALAQLHSIDLSQAHPLLAECRFDVACDVDNPLCGERGASAIFGPQKGATPDMVASLDKTLAHFADVLVQSGFADHRLEAGSGAAGGMGLGAKVFLNATLKPGIDIVMETVGLANKLQGAGLVITGEGRLDGQTVFGKTPMGVLKQANAQNIPAIGIAGSLGQDAEAILAHGMLAIFPIIPALDSLDNVLAQAEKNLINTSRNMASMLKLGHNIG